MLIPLVTLVELTWVLRAGYKFDRMAIVDILRNLISIEGVAVEGEAMIRLALDAFAAGAADFSDYVILESSRSTGAEVVLTFDERFAKTPGVELLSS